MRWAPEDDSALAWFATGVVGAVLAVLLPSLLTTTADASGTMTLAVLTLALATLVRFGVRCVALAARTETAVLSIGDGARPVLSARVTDPVHHPLRPRAPGLADARLE